MARSIIYVSMLKAVLFDLWETLILDRSDRAHPRRVWRIDRVQAIFDRHGFDVDHAAVGAALDATNVALTRLHDEGRDVDGPGRATLLLDVLEQQTGRRAPAALTGELLETIAAMPLDKAPHLAPGAAETLADLRALGLATGLVSNAGMTTAPNLRLMLRHHGIEDCFDLLLFSDELQIAKPDPRIFHSAAQQLGLEAADCAFVGDNPHNDVAGSLAVGMFAVQIGAKQRDGVTAVPSARIDLLSELIPALQAEERLAERDTL
jgi:HAD superfamily hydrolase (TIGR01509 family)